MDEPNRTPPPEDVSGSFLRRILLWIVCADRDVLRQCPEIEWDRLAGFGLLLAMSFVFQSTILAIIAHRLFAAAGHFRIDLTFGALFIAGMITAIDAIMIIQSGFFRAGEEELKRAGLDITDGPLKAVKAWFFLAFRMLLSASIAMLTGIFMSLIVFGSDIDARIHDAWVKANGPLIKVASESVDAGRARAIDTLKDEEKRFNTLSKQALAARQNQLDPLANEPLVQQAQSEQTRLTEQKEKDKDEVRRAEKFESDERGGLRGSAQNSGRAGNGPRYRAAMDQLIYARAHAKTTARELADAQTRLDNLRSRLASSADTLRQKAVDQTPEFEKALAAEGQEHERLKKVVAMLGDDRDGAIQKLVEQAPGYRSPDNGLLAQLKLLEEITEEDRLRKAVVVLIEISSFGLELAAVLAKTMSHIPMSYAAGTSLGVYLRCVALVDEAAARLNKDKGQPDSNGLTPLFVGPTPTPPAGPLGGLPSGLSPSPFEAFGDIGEPPKSPEPPKRKRGRPRKNPLH